MWKKSPKRSVTAVCRKVDGEKVELKVIEGRWVLVIKGNEELEIRNVDNCTNEMIKPSESEEISYNLKLYYKDQAYILEVVPYQKPSFLIILEADGGRFTNMNLDYYSNLSKKDVKGSYQIIGESIFQESGKKKSSVNNFIIETSRLKIGNFVYSIRVSNHMFF